MKNSFNITTGIIAGFFIIIYFSFVYYFTINIPLTDDYSVIQGFLLKFEQSSSLKEKFALLFSQFEEHRIFFAKSIILSVHACSGVINYSALIFIGNLLIIGLGFFMLLTAKNNKIISLYILILVLIFYNGQNFETSTWAMVGLANVGVLFIAMTSMYCMLNTKHNLFYLGLILSVITIFSNGNGMFIIPPIAIGLYLQNRKKNMLVFLCITLVFVFLYFCDFKTGRISIEPIDLIKNLHILFRNFLFFIGLNFWIPSYKFISFSVGLFCISVYLFGIWKKWYKNNLLIYAYLTFYFLSAAAVAITWLNTEISGALRYRLYCSPTIILTLFLVLNNIKTPKLKYIVSLSLCFSLFSLSSTYIYAHKEQKKMEWKKKSAYNWHNKGARLAAFSSNEDYGLHEIEKSGWYQMPKYPLSDYASSVSREKVHTYSETEKISYKIEDVAENGKYISIEGWGFLENKSMNFNRIYVCLINNEQAYIASTFSERRYDLNLEIPLDRIENCGFFAVIDKERIPEGTYQVAIRIKNMFGFGSIHDKITGESIIIKYS